MTDVEIRQPVPLRTVPNIELAAIGTWKASTGTTTFTEADFLNAVSALDCPGVRNPVVKLGHAEADSTSGVRWDGEPSLGWVANMRYDADGKLRGDLTGMPAWLADPQGDGLSVLAAAYPDRSIEIYRPFVCQIGHSHPAVITALALVGVSPPGVGVLKSMQDVYAAWTEPLPADVKATLTTTVAARLSAAPERQETAGSGKPPGLATTIRTSIGDLMTTAGAVKATVSVEDISRKYYEAAGYSMWITAMHVDPLELIASDDSNGKFFRIPVELKGEEFTFGEPQEVAIVYEDVKAAATALPYRWQDRKAALAAAGITDGVIPVTPTITTTGAAGNVTVTYAPPIAPDVSPAGAAIRKMAAVQTPDAGTPAAGSTTEDKEASVDAAKLREALGLAATASDEDVRAALASAIPETPPAPDATPDPQATLTAIPPSAGGAMLIDPENYKTLVSMAAKGERAFAEMQKNKRDHVLDQAMKDGRFPVSRLSAYQGMWDKNPEATEQYIAMMPKNTVPTMSAGLLAAEVSQNETDLVYEAMYGKGN